MEKKLASHGNTPISLSRKSKSHDQEEPRRLTLLPAPSPCSSGTAYRRSMRTVPPSIRTWISRPWCSPTCSASRPAKPRAGEQVVEGRLQACRCVPSQVRLRRVPAHGVTGAPTRVIRLLDNDEALSLPYERVVGLLGEAAKYVCNYAASRGSVRLLKWARENNLDWSAHTCHYAAYNGHLPALQYLHENGCPWDSYTCSSAAYNGHLPALQYLHENGCPWDWTRACTPPIQTLGLPAVRGG